MHYKDTCSSSSWYIYMDVCDIKNMYACTTNTHE